jgi:hypothetical protein
MRAVLVRDFAADILIVLGRRPYADVDSDEHGLFGNQ